MKIKITIMMLLIVATLPFVMAGDFKINYGGSSIFTVATNGSVIAQDIQTTGFLSSVGNITTSDSFIGDGSYLTGVVADSLAENSTTMTYHNITDIPTCGAETYLTFDGTDLSCGALVANSITIAGENITSGTVAEAYLPSTIYTLGLNASELAIGTIPIAVIPTLDYHNITGIPTCTGSDVLTYDGSDLSCTTPSSIGYTNIALINQTNTFTPDQVFTGYVNATAGKSLASNTSIITRDGVETTNMSIDSLGNVIINLG